MVEGVGADLCIVRVRCPCTFRGANASGCAPPACRSDDSLGSLPLPGSIGVFQSWNKLLDNRAVGVLTENSNKSLRLAAWTVVA